MFNRIEDFYRSLLLRRFKTEDLYVTLDVLDAVTPAALARLSRPDEVRKGRLRIARELIRRGEIFW